MRHGFLDRLEVVFGLSRLVIQTWLDFAQVLVINDLEGSDRRQEQRKSSQGTVVQSRSCIRLFATPWTAAHQASLSFTILHSLLKLMSIGSVMPSNHLILCHPLLLLPSVFPSIRVFSNESILCIRWPKYWSFSISPSSESSGLTSFNSAVSLSVYARRGTSLVIQQLRF